MDSLLWPRRLKFLNHFLLGGCRGSGGEIIVKLVPTNEQVFVKKIFPTACIEICFCGKFI